MTTRLRPLWLRPVAVGTVVVLHVVGLALARTSVVEIRPSSAPILELEPAPPEPMEAAVEPPTEVADLQPVPPPEPTSEPEPPPPEAIALLDPVPSTPPKPEKKVEKKKPTEQRPIERRVAPVESAEAHAAKSAADAAARAAAASYAARVAGELERHKRYPAEARAARVEGTVVLSFAIGPSGTIVSHSITRSSGNAAIDAAVHAMVAASRFDPPPGGRFASSIPVRFKLTR